MKPYSPGDAVISPTPALRPKWLEHNSLREGCKSALYKWVRERFKLEKCDEMHIEEKVRYTVDGYNHHYTQILFSCEGLRNELIIDKPLAFIRPYDITKADQKPYPATTEESTLP